MKIRTSNKTERVNAEIRRRLNVIGRHPSEEGCSALIYQVSQNCSYPQQRVKVNELVKQLWNKMKLEKEEMIQQLELDFYAVYDLKTKNQSGLLLKKIYRKWGAIDHKIRSFMGFIILCLGAQDSMDV